MIDYRENFTLSPLGIIAGGDGLPGKLIAAAQNVGRSVFVLAFHGQTDPQTVRNIPHCWLELGKIEAALSALHGAGVRDLVLAGRFRRPALRKLELDRRGAKLLARLGWSGLTRLGDDGLMRVVIHELETEGFRILRVDDILNDVIAEAGQLGYHKADEEASVDIARGFSVLDTITKADIGQAVIVQQGVVLAVEAIEGTDAMIMRSAILQRPGPGGLLVKGRKLGQEERADLPVVGLGTAQAVIASGLRGIVLEAGGTLIIDQAAMIEALDKAGLFILAVKTK